MSATVQEPECSSLNSQAENEVCEKHCSAITPHNRLGKCEVCANNDARYTCPKCEVKTCSLPCVQIHKKELGCDGVRDRTKYVPLKQMTNMEFMSDYYFLEDCTRFVEDRKHDHSKRYTRFNRTLPTHLYKLRKAAADRKTTLRFLLENFSRRKSNTTFYNWKEKHIYWRVEWIFVNASNAKYIDGRCSEDSLLCDLLKKYVDSAECIRQSVPERQRLLYYQSKGVFGIKILLKAENVKNCDNRFYELDASKTLKENLVHKTIVEFPSIYLFTESVCEGLDIIDSDDDVTEEIKRHEVAIQEIRRKQFESQKNDKSDDSTNSEEQQTQPQKAKRPKVKKETSEPVNYLFGNPDDYSSSDDNTSNNEKQKP